MRLLSTAVSALAIALLASPGARAGACTEIETSIVSTFFVKGCKSHAAMPICTAGTIPSGPLAGHTRFTALTVTQGPTPAILLYTGKLVITTMSGKVTLLDYGMFDASTGVYSEIEQVIKGTRTFKRATGTLISQGVATGTGFAGSLRGTICLGDRNGHGDGTHQRSDDFDGEDTDE
jgi:hypothetical protein